MSISDELLEYYNNLISAGVIKIDGPVTLDWLKRQRIVEGRHHLDIRFGNVVVNNIIGEPTYLAKAENMLKLAKFNDNYDLLPTIACMLSWECDSMLDFENPIRKSYSSLDSMIPIPIFEFSTKQLDFTKLNFEDKYLSIDQLKTIITFLSCNSKKGSKKEDSCRIHFFEYVIQSCICVLSKIFFEIKEEVTLKTK